MNIETQGHELLKSETNALYGYLASLDVEAWRGPTACERWDVATMVAHLAGSADAFAERITRGIRGDTTVPDGLPEAGEVNSEAWSETNAERWIAIRKEMGEGLLTQFRLKSRTFNNLVGSLAHDDWEKLCYHPGGLIGVKTLVGFRLLELAVHGWDIRSITDASAGLSCPTVPYLMDFVSDYLEWFFNPTEEPATEVRYLFQLDERSIRDQIISVVDGKATMEESCGEGPQVRVKCRAADLVLLMCGRRRLEQGLVSPHFYVCGQPAEVAKFSVWFPGA